jgi:hypothetical protein
MRLPADGLRVRIARLAAALTLAAVLGACATTGGESSFAESFGELPVNGPQADYPVVVGEAYSIAGTEYVPEDVLNYDEVGLVAADGEGGAGVSGSHHTLPLRPETSWSRCRPARSHSSKPLPAHRYACGGSILRKTTARCCAPVSWRRCGWTRRWRWSKSSGASFPAWGRRPSRPPR